MADNLDYFSHPTLSQEKYAAALFGDKKSLQAKAAAVRIQTFCKSKAEAFCDQKSLQVKAADFGDTKKLCKSKQQIW